MTTEAPSRTLTLVQEIDRAEAIRRGFGGERYQAVKLDLAALTPEDRALVADRMRTREYRDRDGIPAGDYLVDRHGSRMQLPEPTADALIEAVRADEAEVQAETAEQERMLAAALDALEEITAEDLLRGEPPSLGVQNRYELVRLAEERGAGRIDGRIADQLISEARARWPEIFAAAERLADQRNDAERQRRHRANLEEEARAAAAAAAERAERVAWIEAHGSERLRRLLAEGIEHGAVYRDERLALERPGWVWELDTPGRYDAPRNAPMEALVMLDEARKVAPDAKLVYCWFEREIEHDWGVGTETVRGYTAMARFLDRDIVWQVGDDGTPPVNA